MWLDGLATKPIAKHINSAEHILPMSTRININDIWLTY